MSNRRRREPDKALARAFLRNARAFHEAGQAARDRTGASSAYHLAIAIELGLKAYLLHRGIADQWNRVHIRHDLTKALRCARIAGLKDIPEGIAQMAEVLSPLYASAALSRGLREPSWPMPSICSIACRPPSAKMGGKVDDHAVHTAETST